MERYLGIDPHRDSCTLALVSPRGKKVKQMVVPTEGSELVKTCGTFEARCTSVWKRASGGSGSRRF